MNTQAKKQVDDDDIEIETDDDDELQLEIVDDTPPEDRKPPRAETSSDEEDRGDGQGEDEEAEEYSERVQKRIKKLKYEYHEERRAKEEAERMRQEALRFAEQTKAEIERLRKQMSEGETHLYKEAEGRLEAQMKAAQRELKEAYDTGDSDKIVEAQTLLSNLAAEKGRFEALKSRRPQQSEQPQQQPQQQYQQPAKPKGPTPQAQRWAERNPWFNRDAKMTAYAFGVHEDLIRNQGVQPDTEDYYRQIDAEMRKMFPSKFEATADDDDKPATVVAAPSRKAPKKPRTVRLTKTQVALAKRLGITPEAYAAQLMKEQK